MDTRWARIWTPDDSMPCGRRAKARLIKNCFTDPDLLDIESHSPTLHREGFYDRPAVRMQPWPQVVIWRCAASIKHW